MAIDFTIRKFAYPVKILKLRSFLEKSQWFPEEKLKEYQRTRLKEIISHSYENVPYYRNLFDELAFKPDDFQDIDDLKKLPLLTRDIIKKNFHLLTAKNSKEYRPVLYQTSGTTREPMKFYRDRSSHILEFCYYWRYWSWAGYKLGTPFVQFHLHPFLKGNIERFSHYHPLAKQLELNPVQLSFKNLDKFIILLQKYRPLFLKGLPSVIATFAMLLEKAGRADISFRAVFTTAEKLLAHQKQIIEKVFHCPIFDSYGHMESTVAASQCSHGRYHINAEYGVFSIDGKDRIENLPGEGVGEIIGTSLHNFAMPFLRYRVGDMAVMDASPEKCPCGRELPVVKEIIGRTEDIIITPDERFITNVHVPFNYVEGVLWYHVIQESKEKITIKIVKSDDVSRLSIEEKLRDYLRKILGNAMEITFEFVALDNSDRTHKYKPVESRLDIRDFI